MILKWARRARGNFVTLIEICMHLIRVNPGHILFFHGINLLVLHSHSREPSGIQQVHV